jgi:hypothetical protein
MMMMRNLWKLTRRGIPVIMIGIILISGFLNGSYNPFSTSLIAIPPMEMMMPLQEPIGNRSTVAAWINRTFRTPRATMQHTKKLTLPTLRGETMDEMTMIRQQPDALFHDQPAYYVDAAPMVSSVHCVGETFATKAFSYNGTIKTPVMNIDTTTPFIYRSCSFQNLCYDVQRETFILIASKRSRAAETYIRDGAPRLRQAYKSTSWENHTVSLGPMAQRWTEEERRYFEWFPQVVSQQDVKGYYQLDPSLVLVPFAMHGASNPGHVGKLLQ